MSRRRFLALLAAAGAGATVGCRGQNRVEDLSDGEDRALKVLNWSDYIGDATVDAFRAQTGISVDYDEDYEDNESAFAQIFEPTLGRGRRTGWDVIVPTYWAAARLLDRGWLEPLPIERIPNHVNIDPAFLAMPWDRGARYHMPWQVGITGIAYDPELTGRELQAVEDLFAPDLAGRVGMVVEMRESVGLTMLTQGADPSRATVGDAERALARLEQLTRDGHVAEYTTSEFSDRLRSGQFAACLAWSGDIVQLQAERPDIRFVIPIEGGIRWFDTMIIPKRAEHRRAAADWMNFVYDPEDAADITEAVQYISPVLGVRDVLAGRGGGAARLADNPILFPDDETRRRLYFWAGLDAIDEEALQGRFDTITALAGS